MKGRPAVIWKDTPAAVRVRIHPGASLRFAPAHLESSQADVAQLVEQPIRNRQVNGSSPFVGSIPFRSLRIRSLKPAAQAIFASSGLRSVTV